MSDTATAVIGRESRRAVQEGDVDDRTTGIVTGTLRSARDLDLPENVTRALDIAMHYVARQGSLLSTVHMRAKNLEARVKGEEERNTKLAECVIALESELHQYRLMHDADYRDAFMAGI